MTTRSRRAWTLVLSAVVLVLVASALRQLEFSPGYSLPSATATAVPPGEELKLPLATNVIEYITLALYALFILLLPVAIRAMIKSPAARRRLFTTIILYLLFVSSLLFVRYRPEMLQLPAELPTSEQAEIPSMEATLSPFEASPAPAAWVVWVVTAGLALLTAALIVGVGWLVWRYRPREPELLEQLGHEAQQAIDALQSGADLRDAVIRCYYQMAQVLRTERGVRREADMTPREFEVRLCKLGLPQQHVARLTHLFEEVRYGTLQAGPLEQEQAVASLTAIVEADPGRS